MVGKLNRPHNDMVVILQRRIRWMENYYRLGNINDLQQLKQELADLFAEDAKANKLRSLPLYSCGLVTPLLWLYTIHLCAHLLQFSMLNSCECCILTLTIPFLKQSFNSCYPRYCLSMQ
jgi:hypothetical protein